MDEKKETYIFDAIAEENHKFGVFVEESYKAGYIHNLSNYMSADGRFRIYDVCGWPKGFKILLFEKVSKNYEKSHVYLFWGSGESPLNYKANPSEKDIRKAFSEGRMMEKGEVTEEDKESFGLPF